MRIIQLIRRFLELPLEDKGLLLRALYLLPIAWVSLGLTGLVATHRWMGRAVRGKPRTTAPGVMQRSAQMVALAGRHSLGRSTCLTRSLVLIRLLKQRGFDSQLRIGVRITNGALDAHAWVEHDGVPVNDRRGIGEEFAAFAEAIPLDAFGR